MKEKILIILIVFIPVFLFNSCKKDPIPDNENKISVIIDTDADVDDAMAILYLLQHPEISVDGITISGTGMSHPIPATKNILGLIELAGNPNIPVATGDTVAINSNNTLLRPAEWLTMANTMMDIELPLNPNPVNDKGAVDFLIDFIANTDEPVRFVALGPLTNLGCVLMQSPNLAAKISSIYIMGGAVNVSGNLDEGGIDNNPYAEWNIFLDPHAADIVFNSGIDITLVPLDATNNAPITTEFLNLISNNHNTPEANFVFEIISKLLNGTDKVCFWDPLAAAISTDLSIASTNSYLITIITEEGDENGRTKIDSVSGNMITVCYDVDLNNFETLFLDVLNGK
ncbi:MAG: nucleoside hydrolase [Bacteroidota bacterium]